MSSAAAPARPAARGRLDPLGERILAAASELLSHQGADGLNVRRIAERAGTSTMGVYSRFGGKLGVVEALYLEGFERLRRETAPLVENAAPLEALEAMCDAYRRSALANAAHYELMFGGAVPGFDPAPEARAEAMRSYDEVVVEAMRRAVEAGLMKGDPAELGFRLWALVHGLVSLELSGALPPETASASGSLYRRAVRAFLEGSRAQASGSSEDG